MKTVSGPGQLDYRDGRAGDVDPVRIERTPGRVRVVARYPARAVNWALTRMLVSAAVVVTIMVIGWTLTTRFPWWGLLLSFSQLGVVLVVIMTVMWWRAGWVYVFEATPNGLSLETRGRFSNHERSCTREHITDVGIVTDRRGHATAMSIRSSNRLITGMWLVGMGDQHVRAATAAIREGLGMETAA